MHIDSLNSFTFPVKVLTASRRLFICGPEIIWTRSHFHQMSDVRRYSTEQRFNNTEQKVLGAKRELAAAEKEWVNAKEGSDVKAHYFRRMESAQRVVDYYSNDLFAFDSDHQVIVNFLQTSVTHTTIIGKRLLSFSLVVTCRTNCRHPQRKARWTGRSILSTHS